jgi:hypothetical protein
MNRYRGVDLDFGASNRPTSGVELDFASRGNSVGALITPRMFNEKRLSAEESTPTNQAEKGEHEAEPQETQ